MTIPLILDAEYQSALDGMLADFNESANQSLTESQYLAEVLKGTIGGEVKALFDQTVQRIGTAAANLPYAERQALITQLETQLA